MRSYFFAFFRADSWGVHYGYGCPAKRIPPELL
jgi:hypothetical protein